MRQVYFDPPRYNLTQFIGVQMLINNIDPDEVARRTPIVVSQQLKHLEVLFEKKICHKKKILSSFYDLNSPKYFEKPWGLDEEKNMMAIKAIINDNKFIVSTQADTRMLAMLMIDFLESLGEAPISPHTVAHLAKMMDEGLNSAELVQQVMSHTLVVPRDPNKVGLSDLESEQV